MIEPKLSAAEVKRLMRLLVPFSGFTVVVKARRILDDQLVALALQSALDSVGNGEKAKAA